MIAMKFSGVFEIQTDQPSPVRRQVLVLINKINILSSRILVVLVEMKENEKIDKYLDLVRELKRKLKLRLTVVGAVIAARKGLKKDWSNWKSEEMRPSRPQLC